MNPSEAATPEERNGSSKAGKRNNDSEKACDARAEAAVLKFICRVLRWRHISKVSVGRLRIKRV